MTKIIQFKSKAELEKEKKNQILQEWDAYIAWEKEAKKICLKKQ